MFVSLGGRSSRVLQERSPLIRTLSSMQAFLWRCDSFEQSCHPLGLGRWPEPQPARPSLRPQYISSTVLGLFRMGRIAAGGWTHQHGRWTNSHNHCQVARPYHSPRCHDPPLAPDRTICNETAWLVNAQRSGLSTRRGLHHPWANLPALRPASALSPSSLDPCCRICLLVLPAASNITCRVI